ncbi:MAG: hypothetical protein SOW25_02985 [Helicobacter sp.]|nr:hypothetical protein [Helicobacteraceae bacterium]MDY3113275.1 hypothetical protein [Helicobacter sp.]
MQYYIYPKGGHGRTLGEMIKFLDSSVDIKFIDDYYKDISLQTQKEEILKSGAKVLLALEQKNPYSRVIMQTLVKNLKGCGISNYENNMLWYSSQIVKKTREILAKQGWSAENTIGVGVYNHAGEKHLGFVDSELKKQGFNVLYLCSNDVSYQIYRQKDADNSLAIPLVVEHYDLVDYIFAIYMTTPLNYKNPKVKYFYQPHGIADMCEGIIRFGGINESMEILRHTDYIMAPTKKEVAIIKDALSEYGCKAEVLSVGYPAFEIVENQLESCKEYKRDSLFIAVSDESDLEAIKDGVRLLLDNKIKVIFRPRPYFKKQVVDEFIDYFKDSSYFSLDLESKISAHSYKASFAVVTTASSVGYTYPLTTFCPAILYFSDVSKKECKWRQYAYFDSNLHLFASKPQELLEAAVYARNNVAKNKEIIEKYKKEQVFNLGSASKIAAKMVKEKLKEVES